jgi:hypothetical protein
MRSAADATAALNALMPARSPLPVRAGGDAVPRAASTGSGVRAPSESMVRDVFILCVRACARARVCVHG